MNNGPLRIHLWYESSTGGEPHGCSHIRLLRPFSHPSLAASLAVSQGPDLPEPLPDVVIIERLWDNRCDSEADSLLLDRLKKNGCTIICELDDDLLSLGEMPDEQAALTIPQKMWLRWMLRSADGVIVSTPNLAQRVRQMNPRTIIVPNALDERLFMASSNINHRQNRTDRITFGYMGTFTHQEDLLSIIEPLRNVLARHRDKAVFELVGISDAAPVRQLFAHLPINIRTPSVSDSSYERFAGWMQQHLQWDFGIAPLVDTVFTRSKSDIKFLDYAVQGIPGIFSAVPAYSGTVTDRHNGLLAASPEAWETALEQMICDADLRTRLARQAHQQVWQSRMLRTCACCWETAVRQIHTRKPS